MEHNYKNLLVFALTPIMTAAGFLSQAGGLWKIARPVYGLDSLMSRSFGSQHQAIEAVADYFIAQAIEGTVPGVKLETTDQNSVRRAV